MAWLERQSGQTQDAGGVLACAVFRSEAWITIFAGVPPRRGTDADALLADIWLTSDAVVFGAI
jgi:hypothetical protein